MLLRAVWSKVLPAITINNGMYLHQTPNHEKINLCNEFGLLPDGISIVIEMKGEWLDVNPLWAFEDGNQMFFCGWLFSNEMKITRRNGVRERHSSLQIGFLLQIEEGSQFETSRVHRLPRSLTHEVSSAYYFLNILDKWWFVIEHGTVVMNKDLFIKETLLSLAMVASPRHTAERSLN